MSESSKDLQILRLTTAPSLREAHPKKPCALKYLEVKKGSLAEPKANQAAPIMSVASGLSWTLVPRDRYQLQCCKMDLGTKVPADCEVGLCSNFVVLVMRKQTSKHTTLPIELLSSLGSDTSPQPILESHSVSHGCL